MMLAKFSKMLARPSKIFNFQMIIPRYSKILQVLCMMLENFKFVERCIQYTVRLLRDFGRNVSSMCDPFKIR